MKYHRAGGGYGGSYDAGYPETESYVSDAQVGNSGGTYVVQSGDTMSGIAAELGTTVEDLAAANGLGDPNRIYAGQTLYY